MESLNVFKSAFDVGVMLYGVSDVVLSEVDGCWSGKERRARCEPEMKSEGAHNKTGGLETPQVDNLVTTKYLASSCLPGQRHITHVVVNGVSECYYESSLGQSYIKSGFETYICQNYKVCFRSVTEPGRYTSRNFK